VAELVDAGDLKSSVASAASGFKSRLRHQEVLRAGGPCPDVSMMTGDDGNTARAIAA
jgi:hypothetical protein